MTSHASQYASLQKALVHWTDLWGNSIFHRFSEMERLVPEEWFEFGTRADLRSQWELGQGLGAAGAPASLREWVADLRASCELPRADSSVPISAPWDRDLTPKKKHEIEALLGLFQSFKIRPAKIVDIGGGAGHLARHLAKVLDCPVISIDRDSALQASGARIQTRWPWKNANPVRFVHGVFPEVALDPIDDEGAWSVGLHTCAQLAWSHLELVRSGISVLNFGCCYERLDPQRDVQRSQTARRAPLPWTREALFLANRGGVERTLEEFGFQQRMQRFRFALHELLLSEGFPSEQAAAVGSAREEIYRASFAAYARDRARLALDDEAIEAFFEGVRARIERKRFLSFLRNLLARPIEVALLLDRAMTIEESAGPDVEVRLIELFDARLSPRNVGILIRRVVTA